MGAKTYKGRQTRIAGILDPVEAVIETLTRSIAASQQLAASLLSETSRRRKACAFRWQVNNYH